MPARELLRGLKVGRSNSARASAPWRCRPEKLIVSQKLAHCPNPVTRWMAANVAVAQDSAGNLKPAKDKSTERIDGIVTMIMAIGRAMVDQEEQHVEYQLFWV